MSNRRLAALLSGVRFGKFASVGAVGAVFDVTTTTALMFLFDVVNEYAKLAGAEVAILVMFFINEHWTFADAGTADGFVPTLRRLLTSNVVRSGGLAVQFLVVRAFREAGFSFLVFGFDAWELLPIPLAIGASMMLNYVAESLFTWRIVRS